MKSAKYATFFMGLAVINTINAHEAESSSPTRLLSVAVTAVSIAIAWYCTFVQQERAA